MYIKTKLIDTQRTDWWLPKAGGEWYRNNGTAFFLWKFKCSERNPKSPTVTVAVLLPNTLRNLGMRAPAAPRPCPHTHTHTHTHTRILLSVTPRVQAQLTVRSAWRALALPFPMTRISFNAAFGEASSHGSLL